MPIFVCLDFLPEMRYNMSNKLYQKEYSPMAKKKIDF